MNILENLSWSIPKEWMQIETIDMHTGGEPLRVITKGLPEIKGNTILEKRRYFRDHYDHIRTGLMWEPRGHADQYGAVIVEAEREDSDFGTFFMHNEGYSTMCGHATLALVKLVLETGMIVRPEKDPEIRIDAPPGQLRCKAFRDGDKVTSVSFLNVPCFMPFADAKVEVPGIGEVTFDLGFGGAFYAFVDADSLGLKMDGSDYNRLIDYGRRIKYAVMENFEIKHPFFDDLSFLYGTIFTGKPFDKKNWSRNVCVFAEGEVDRSPTGSGVSARAAIHYAKGELKMGEKVAIESILGTIMEVEVVEETTYGEYNAVVPRVSGSANIIGVNKFCFDPDDQLNNGFIFR